MELLDEDFQRRRNKNENKSKTIILISIIALFIIIIAIVILMASLKEEKLVAYLDNAPNAKILSILVFDEKNSNKIYIPIRDVAGYFNYKDYSGEYDNLSESSSKCYVQSENEVANCALNSNEIYKKSLTEDNDYKLEKIDEPIKAINGKLYTTIDGIEKIFNVSFSYDIDNKKIEIYTLPYLIKAYSSAILDYGYETIDENFSNQKSVLDDILIVTKGGKYAAIKTNGEVILEDKYENIKYLDKSEEFLITNNGKQGIIEKNRNTKIGLEYEEIIPMNYDNSYFAVRKNGKYGVIDSTGKSIIYPQYAQIGIDATQFKSNGIKNSYFLLDTLIPIKNENNLWGLANTRGKLISREFKYDQIGYIESSSSTERNLLVVPDYDVIVVKRDEKYTVITVDGNEVWQAVFDSIYMSNTSGKTEYIVSRNEQTTSLTDLLEKMGIGKKKTTNLQNSNNTDDNNTTATPSEENTENTNTETTETE